MNLWVKSFEVAILKKIDEIEDRGITMLDVGVLPWHGSIELSVLYEGDIELEGCFEDDVASWPSFDFSGYSEGLWPEITVLCEEMKNNYNSDKSLKKGHFQAVAQVMKSSIIQSKLSTKELSTEFKITVLDPDTDQNYF